MNKILLVAFVLIGFHTNAQTNWQPIVQSAKQKTDSELAPQIDSLLLLSYIDLRRETMFTIDGFRALRHDNIMRFRFRCARYDSKEIRKLKKELYDERLHR